MMFGFFGPWIRSCTYEYSDWGNAPHYLSEYAPLSGGVPTGDLGAGYFQPDVYFGFETVWIYLLGFGHFLGIHTFAFLIGLGAVLVILYNMMSLSVFFHGTEAKARLLGRAKLTAILSVVFMALGWLQSFLRDDKRIQFGDYYGYIVTFTALFASMIFEFKDDVAAQSVPKPALWLRASITLVVSSLFLPIVFLPPSSTSATASDCDMLNGFVVPASRWANMDENALQTWIEDAPNFDNIVDKGSFGNTNNLDYRLTWFGYGHEGFYEAYFTEHYLRAISAHVSNGIPLALALECFGEPEAYLAVLEHSSTGGFDSLLIQLWYPTKGIVLDHQDVGDNVQSTQINEQLKIKGINFVQPGSIETIADRAFLLDSSWLFPNWATFFRPWSGSPQEIQVIEITE
jgi:hypothetical protein